MDTKESVRNADWKRQNLSMPKILKRPRTKYKNYATAIESSFGIDAASCACCAEEIVGVVSGALCVVLEELPHAASAAQQNVTARPIEMLRRIFMPRSLQDRIA